MNQRQKTEDAQALKRATVIMEVRSGRISAMEGARQLGVSRKTYYEWEQKALAGMMRGLTNGQSGRPQKQVDTEKDLLKKNVRELEGRLEIARKSEVVRNILDAMDKKDKHLSGKMNKKKR